MAEELKKTGVRLVAEQLSKFKSDMNAAKGSVTDFGKQGSKGMSDVKDALGRVTGLGSRLGDFASMAGIAGLAVAGLHSEMKLFKDWSAYALDIGDFAAKLGTSTEEASALREMADDLGISGGSLEMAFRKMANNGISPSIAGLIQVRQKLDAAKNPTAKLALAQDLLGKSGGDLIPIFDQLTNEQLRDYVDTMRKSQVITADQVALARRERAALDTVSDSWKGVKLSVGGFLAMKVDEPLQRINDVLSGQVPYWQALAETLGLVKPPLAAVVSTAQLGGDSIYYLKGAIAAAGTGAGLTVEEWDALNKKWEGSSIAADTLAAKIRGLTRDEYLNQIASTLTGEARLQFMFQTGLLTGSEVMLARQLQVNTAEFDLNKNGVIDAGEETQRLIDKQKALAQSIRDIPAFKFTKIYILTVEERQSLNTAQGPGMQRQYGGAVYPGRTYRINEAGQEMFIPSTKGEIIGHGGLERIVAGLAQIATLAQSAPAPVPVVGGGSVDQSRSMNIGTVNNTNPLTARMFDAGMREWLGGT